MILIRSLFWMVGSSIFRGSSWKGRDIWVPNAKKCLEHLECGWIPSSKDDSPQPLREVSEWSTTGPPQSCWIGHLGTEKATERWCARPPKNIQKLRKVIGNPWQPNQNHEPWKTKTFITRPSLPCSFFRLWKSPLDSAYRNPNKDAEKKSQ